ncbi:PREDICTED: TIP41-like protein [Acanthisitta chloris]|uniref:TIP41-like protein n=1 Tax=Acanthisitta chloris TaxID=57068 RepID=UPI0004F0FB53|nr:PREDICTED: TIP41-like protein [Acanthisitta chloris]
MTGSQLNMSQQCAQVAKNANGILPAYLEKGNGAGEGCGIQVSEEWPRVFSLEKTRLWEDLIAVYNYLKGGSVKLAEELHMPSLPEMMFGDNILRIQHDRGFGIEFNATDALKCVNNCQGMIKVACAEEWQESRSETEHTKEVVKPYDWTYTTDYKGTLLGDTATLKVVPTTEHINTEKLKAREQIMFFEEVLLFEDELHDHGVSSLSVKIRVMPSSFFVLLRFFLRVDGVLIRMNDTRLHHEADKAYMLREYTSRESKISSLKHVPPSLFTEPNEISQYLPIKETICEKLEFPEKLEPKPEAPLETMCVKSK